MRLVAGTVSRRLRERGVTEEEVEKIAHVQLEGRENVILFLQAEGALRKDNSFGQQSRRRRGRWR